MKITFLVPHLKISGGVRILLGYAEALSVRGNDVTVYVESRSLLRRVFSNLLHVTPSWIGKFHGHIVRVPKFTADVICDADVLIATTYKIALLIENFPSTKGRQFYLLQHDEGLYHGNRNDVDQAYRLTQQKIVVATWLKTMLKEKYTQESFLLLNPVDMRLFHKIARTINDGTIRVLLLHHTYEWKGIKEGVVMIEELKKKYPNVRLIMYGARQKGDIEYSCDEYYYNLPQDRLAWLYSNCDIFLCPSWDEGFGLPSVEAMACGVAVVTYDNGGSRDFAFHEKTALVAPRRDSVALARELERLIVYKELRDRIAGEGERFVHHMANWDIQTEKLEDILCSAKR